MIALRNFETAVSTESADVFGIITDIVRESLLHLSPSEAEKFVKNEYNYFKHFDVHGAIRDALRNINRAIPVSGVSEIFEAVRLRFNNPEREHEYFLFFIISKLIESKKLSISRGSCIIEISRGRIPRPSRLVRFFKCVGTPLDIKLQKIDEQDNNSTNADWQFRSIACRGLGVKLRHEITC